MSIEIIHGTPHLTWVGVLPGETIYNNGLVCKDNTDGDEGVQQLIDAAGVANVTNHDIPLLCIGNNRRNPLFDATNKQDYITAPAAADAHDGASIDYVGTSNKPLGDPIPMVKIAMLDNTTILRASLYNAAVGTAPTLLTATNTSTDGLGITTNACDFGTPVAENRQTIYCRTGANAGVYRETDSTSTTVHTWDVAMKNDIAIGDTFVMVPVTKFGPATVEFDATSGAYIEVQESPVTAGTNLWSIYVTTLNLEVAGQEFVEFRFDPSHFGTYTTTA